MAHPIRSESARAAATREVVAANHPLAPAIAKVSEMLHSHIRNDDSREKFEMADTLVRALVDLIRGVLNMDGWTYWLDESAAMMDGVLEIQMEDQYLMVNTADGSVALCEEA